MNKYGEPTGKLSEGIYRIEEGYEFVGTYNGNNIIIQKKPDFKEYDFVVFEDGWYGILKTSNSFFISISICMLILGEVIVLAFTRIE